MGRLAGITITALMTALFGPVGAAAGAAKMNKSRKKGDLTGTAVESLKAYVAAGEGAEEGGGAEGSSWADKAVKASAAYDMATKPISTLSQYAKGEAVDAVFDGAKGLTVSSETKEKSARLDRQRVYLEGLAADMDAQKEVPKVPRVQEDFRTYKNNQYIEEARDWFNDRGMYELQGYKFK